MVTTILLFLIPLVAWIIIAKLVFKHEFTIEEMSIQAGITALFLVFIFFIGYSAAEYDEKIVSGKVTALEPVEKTCKTYWSDSPDSFCTNRYTRQVRNGETCTTVNNKRSCTPRYKTQYKSVYPWERRYFINTTLHDFEIDRVDPQGANTPPRFSEVKVDDPVAEKVGYVNYIKAAASTLFNQKLENVPQISYPNIYDYYHVDQVFYTDTPAPAYLNDWNRQLEYVNSMIRKKEVNVIINVTGKDQNWAEELAQSWDAHNINDVVIVIGVTGEKINWVDVRSWSEEKIANIAIRDEILNLGIIDKDKINGIITNDVIKYYKAQPMENFKYLEDDIPPPTWMLVLAGIILLIVTPTVSYFLSKNDFKSYGPIYKTRRK